jgi:AcrR family transcriptional regulator
MTSSISTSAEPGPAPGTAPLSRRQRQRQATVAEIKTLARRQLATQGPGALSLRAIARQMGTASSALYRYFASHDELISALCVDAYDALADALTAARDTQPPDDHAGQWWAICHAFRRWALDHPADFALIFGTPQPGYQAPEQATGPAAGRATQIPLHLYAAAVQAGAANPDRTQLPASLNLQVGELLHSLLGQAVDQAAGNPTGDAGDPAAGYPPRLAAIALNAYASLLGYLVAELFGSLTRLITDTDPLFDAHVRTVMLGMGFNPATTS